MKLNSKIKFLSESQVQQPDGGFEVTEIVDLETWANVEQLKVSKDIEQAEQKLPLVFRVTIRDRENFYPDVGNIVEFKGKRFVIINTPHQNEVIRTRYLTFDIK